MCLEHRAPTNTRHRIQVCSRAGNSLADGTPALNYSSGWLMQSKDGSITDIPATIGGRTKTIPLSTLSEATDI